MSFKKGKTEGETKKVLSDIFESLSTVDWDKTMIEEAIRRYQKQIGWSNTDLFQTIRSAATGSTATPPLFETMEAIGKDKVTKRLEIAVKKLSN